MARVAYFVSHPIQYQAPLLRALTESGLDVETVFHSLAGAEAYFDPGYGKQITWDVPVLGGYSSRCLPSAPASLPRLYQICRAELLKIQPTVVWIHGWSGPFCRAAWAAAKGIGVPVMLRGDTHLKSIRGGSIRRSLHKRVYSTLFRTVNQFLAVGNANAGLYSAYGVPDSRITIMPYTVDNAYFRRRSSEAALHRDEFRESLKLEAGIKTILFVGRLSPDKDLPTLLRASRRLIESWQGPPPRVLIAGDGPMRNELTQLSRSLGIENSVQFLGFRNQSELPALYDLCDVFVLPSTFEPWGLVVNEVMNAGRPILVSDRVGCGPDLVQPSRNGFIFKVGDDAALAGHLSEYLRSEAVATTAGNLSRDIINRSDLHSNVTQFITALSKVGERGSPA